MKARPKAKQSSVVLEKQIHGIQQVQDDDVWLPVTTVTTEDESRGAGMWHLQNKGNQRGEVTAQGTEDRSGKEASMMAKQRLKRGQWGRLTWMQLTWFDPWYNAGSPKPTRTDS